MAKRITIPPSLRLDMLIEAGYRCAVPRCRTILTLELHHIDPVREDGENAPDNLIALCPNCHTMLEKGMIAREAINVYKTLLVSLSQAFDKESISNLLFLKKSSQGILPKNKLYVTGDGVLKFSHLVASDLAEFEQYIVNGPLVLYEVRLTNKGKRIIEAWFSGSMKQVRQALNDIPFEGNIT
ncbi:MAG: HNH endonuclease [Ktedonobacteraceae bacterium]